MITEARLVESVNDSGRVDAADGGECGARQIERGDRPVAVPQEAVLRDKVCVVVISRDVPSGLMLTGAVAPEPGGSNVAKAPWLSRTKPCCVTKFASK